MLALDIDPRIDAFARLVEDETVRLRPEFPCSPATARFAAECNVRRLTADEFHAEVRRLLGYAD